MAEKIDDGYSGVLFDRPAFQEMMRMIEQGEGGVSHEYRIKQFRAAMRLPGNPQKKL